MPLPFPFTVYGANRSSAPTDDCFTYCYGGDWVQGKVGNYGMSFDGTNDYVSVNNEADLGLSDGTLTFWAKSTTVQSGGKIIVGASRASYSNNSHLGFALYQYSADGVSSTLYGNVGNGINYAFQGADSTITNPTDWHHYAMKWNSPQDTSADLTIYMDGEKLASSYTSNGVSWTAGTDIGNQEVNLAVFGRSSGGGYWNGELDEVALWDVPLTDAQISLLSTGSARADSITPPTSDNGDWSTTYKKIGSQAVHINNPLANASGVTASLDLSDFDLTGDGPFTISYWHYHVGALGAGLNWQFSFGTTSNYSAFLYDISGGRIYWGIADSTYPLAGQGYIQKNTTGVVLAADAWNHIVFTYSGNRYATGLKLYINGAEITSVGTDSNNPLNGNRNSAVYNWGKRANGALNGEFYMDDHAIWNVELNSDAVLEVYNSGSANVGALASNVSSSALKGYWDFENPGPGSTTISGAFGLDATMVGASMDGGGTGSLLMYYDFEIGDSNPVSGNFPGNTTVYDVVTASFHGATAHTGTMTNMSVADFGAWGQGKLGKYSFLGDGVNDFVEIASSSLLPVGDGSDSFSVAFWANNVDALSSYETIISRHTSDATIWSDGWNIQYDNAGNDEMHFFVGEYDNIANHAEIVWDSAANTTFRHVVATYDHSANVSQLWLNGVKGTDGVKSAASPLPGTGRVQIGGLGTTSAYNWGGNIDEVSIWSGVLDTDSIASLAAGAKANAITPPTATLTAYYDMECNGPGSAVIKDLGANELSGTLMNSSIGTCGAG